MNKKGFYKFKMFLIENDIKQVDVARSIDMPVSTFNQKINRNRSTFTLEEASKICEVYSLSLDKYFFVDVVPNLKRNYSVVHSA